MRWKKPAYYLARLMRMVHARGGRLLSSTYVNDWTKLRFRCGEGHEWAATPGKIKQGQWCARCGRLRAGAGRGAAAAVRLRRMVARRGGTILSPAYGGSQTKLRYRCGQGHEWVAVPNSILQGTWCPTCAAAARSAPGVPPEYLAARRKAVSDRLRRIAKERGGTMLSPFEHSRRPVRFRCRRGHTWEMLAGSIDGGAWCRRCKEETLLESLRAAAERREGECLSRACRGTRDEVDLRCAQGHRWTAQAHVVLRGHWCARCRSPMPYDIEQMRAIARERGGQCLSGVYVDSGTNLRWRCRNGHEWDARPGSIVRGHWCRVCERGWGKSRSRLSTEIMRAIASERGGACLSSDYRGIYGRLRWRCARGHTWVTAANNVRRGGWCPTCAHSARGTIDGMRALAVERGGRCITRTWNDHRQPLRFECGRGHRFLLGAAVVKTGVWCPECRA